MVYTCTMRIFYSTILLFFLLIKPFIASSMDMYTLRREYIEAVEDEKKTNDLLEKLSKKDITDPVLIAYKGALEALKAKHAFNPYNKINYLRKSQQTLEKAISMSPDNIEIRFLRFSINHYLPAFLRMTKDMHEDREAIVKNFNTSPVDQEVRESIGKFMIESGRCSPQEIAQIKSVLGAR